MAALLEPWNARGSILLAVAAPREADAALAGLGATAARAETWKPIPVGQRFELILTGVGKANASGAMARALDPSRVSLVLNLGIGGVFPGNDLPIGSSVVGTSSVFADEGIQSPQGFQDVGSIGFPPFPEGAMAATGDPDVIQALESITDQRGVIATVSTCSATDALAHEISSRTGAVVEAMEGAAIGLAAAWVNRITGASVPFAELRVISNTTGDRQSQRWDLDQAFQRLTELVSQL